MIEKLPANPHPFEKIRKRWVATQSMAGVGIDPDPAKIPQHVWDRVGGRQNLADGFFSFAKEIIDATAPLGVAYKVNPSYFPGEQGRNALARIFRYLKSEYPDVLRISDGKFGDVGHTAEKLAAEIFDGLEADAVLLNPYMGYDAIEPFVSRQDKISIVCINTSNPSADEVQGLILDNGKPLALHLLEKSMTDWNKNNNIIPVLSATHPEILKAARRVVGETPILLAGVGAQGGELSASVPNLLDSQGYGLIICSSRSILYAARDNGESIGEAAKREMIRLKEGINSAKDQAGK